ncbi:hypothetical protein U9M48_013769 [Paspalum notatum var. saurae]|uniref:Uncharacterized protein n=1 Tax=Paspalum notatum var. saurae TaxID=547442 RepID=A0AAQ3T2X9_PASNO
MELPPVTAVGLPFASPFTPSRLGSAVLALSCCRGCCRCCFESKGLELEPEILEDINWRPSNQQAFGKEPARDSARTSKWHEPGAAAARLGAREAAAVRRAGRQSRSGSDRARWRRGQARGATEQKRQGQGVAAAELKRRPGLARCARGGHQALWAAELAMRLFRRLAK